MAYRLRLWTFFDIIYSPYSCKQILQLFIITCFKHVAVMLCCVALCVVCVLACPTLPPTCPSLANSSPRSLRLNWQPPLGLTEEAPLLATLSVAFIVCTVLHGVVYPPTPKVAVSIWLVV